MITTHNDKELELINNMLLAEGVADYRFCIENDCYICTTQGEFYSVCKIQYSKSGNLIKKYRVIKLKGSIDKNGYKTYRITVDGVKKHLKGHRLVLNAWEGTEPDLVVNHIDGNKLNNHLKNLEWATVAENNAHAIRTGLFNPYSIKQSYRIPLEDWITIYILNKHCGYSLTNLSEINSCSRGAIKSIVNRIESILPQEVVYGR